MKARFPIRWIGKAFLAALGLGAAFVVVQSVGTGALAHGLKRCLPLIPVLFVLEAVRISLEMVATTTLVGQASARISQWWLLRTHLVAYSLSMSLPAGRAAAEAYKASALCRPLGGAVATSLAATSQGLALMASSVIGLVLLPFVYAGTGPSYLTLGLALNSVLCGAVAIGLHLLSRHPALLAGVVRIVPASGLTVEKYREASARLGPFPMRPLLIHVLNRSVQIAQVSILVISLGQASGILDGLAGYAVLLVGATAGDFVPLQMGATDGAWVLSARLVHLQASDAAAVAMSLHLVHVVWVSLGALSSLVLPSSRGDRAPRMVGSGVAKLSLALLVVWNLAAPHASAQAFRPHDVRTIFFVAKSENRNEVHYALKLSDRCEPLGAEPVVAYWHMREQGGRFEPLLDIEEGVYGVARQRVEKATVVLSLAASPGREIRVTALQLPDGQCGAIATTRIRSEIVRLESIYVHIGFLAVDYALIRGRRMSDGTQVQERIEP